MSSASLSKMSINVDGQNQALLMPKLAYRFRVTFQNFGASSSVELTKQVVNFKRPEVSFAEIPLHIYNSTVKLAGKHTWAPTSCEIRDDATGSVSKVVGEQLQKQLDFMEQASAAAGNDYKFTALLEMLDGGNGAHDVRVLEAWEMYGCYLTSVGYGQMDYSSNEAVKLSLNISYDNAIQLPTALSAGGVGIDVGRTLGDLVNAGG